MTALLRIAVLLTLVVSVGCAGSRAGATGPTAAASPAAGAKPGFEPWEKTLEETRRVEGMFTMHVKRDQGLLLELAPSQLDRDYALALYFSQGVSDLGINQGMPIAWETRLMNFRRVGDHIQLVHRNRRYTADDGSPMRTAVDASVGHSVVAAFKIISEQAESKHVLVNLTPLLLSDYAEVDARLKPYFKDRSAAVDAERSHVRQVQAFPRNVEIDVELTFRAPPGDRPVAHMVSDSRSIPVGIRYSFFELPEQPMRPRYADPRVGNFVTSVYDYSYTGTRDPFLKFVNRWRLERPAEAGSGLVEPVQPIVFFLDHSIPHELRPAVREGVEAWNKAFEAAGFRNAIVARDAPEDDDTWNPEDIRYSTIRWLADPWGWAIGPSDMDPRTGEILNADILIASGITSYYGADTELFGDAAGGAWSANADLGVPSAHGRPAAGRAGSRDLCLAARGRGVELRSQHLLLAGLGIIDGADPLPMEYVHGALRDLVMHEVGHTLGLRHNFRGSSAIPYERLQDTAYTRRHGLSLSVMDYVPVNIAADPRQQGHYWNVEVGTYDMWAIEYAYAPVYVEAGSNGLTPQSVATTSADELPGLARIAARAAEPLHAYGTDEDVLTAFGVDPLTVRMDLSADPLRWARDRAELAVRLEPVLEQRLIRDGESYVRLRDGMSRLLYLRFGPLSGLTRYVGGLYAARDHKGDPHQRPPFTPVPAAEQREAVALIVEQAFAENAFRFDPDLLNRLAPDRNYHWGTSPEPPLDFPLHERAAALQNNLLASLLAPPRLARLVDNGARMPAGAEAYTLHELLATLTTAIWVETGRPVAAARNANSFRRNLQRAYLDRMIALLTTTPAPGQPQIPGDARASARHELLGLSRRLDVALAAPARLDLPTRAHFAESRARIGRALDASVQVAPGR